VREEEVLGTASQQVERHVVELLPGAHSPYRCAVLLARYNVRPAVVYEWVARGLVPYRKLPGRKALLFNPSDLDLYDCGETRLERRKTPGGGVICRPSAVTQRLQKRTARAGRAPEAENAAAVTRVRPALSELPGEPDNNLTLTPK
jgi:hypothetical protein